MDNNAVDNHDTDTATDNRIIICCSSNQEKRRKLLEKFGVRDNLNKNSRMIMIIT